MVAIRATTGSARKSLTSAGVSLRFFPIHSGCCLSVIWLPAGPLDLMNGVQDDYRYLAVGLERIVGIRRPELERLRPKSRAFVPRRRSRLQLLGRDLHLDIRVGEDIAVPTGVFGRSAL